MANKPGQPSKLASINLEKVTFLAMKGFTDKEIAKTLDISEASLNKYKKDEKFLESLKKGKEISDSAVEKSLYERATGYSCPEDKVFCCEGKIITEPTIKHYPPDPTSMIFWLKNRKPEQWKEAVEVGGAVELTVNVKKTYRPIDKNLIEEVNG